MKKKGGARVEEISLVREFNDKDHERIFAELVLLRADVADLKGWRGKVIGLCMGVSTAITALGFCLSRIHWGQPW